MKRESNLIDNDYIIFFVSKALFIAVFDTIEVCLVLRCVDETLCVVDGSSSHMTA